MLKKCLSWRLEGITNDLKQFDNDLPQLNNGYITIRSWVQSNKLGYILELQCGAPEDDQQLSSKQFALYIHVVLINCCCTQVPMQQYWNSMLVHVTGSTFMKLGIWSVYNPQNVVLPTGHKCSFVNSMLFRHLCDRGCLLCQSQSLSV